ncbi:hypothetical protein MLD38_016593 [Melastoma candidum]|uniref:Uncharacterized protein n=1 Tax=Melastoma candidum TaxID=119954 RepID=A0ACB9QW33_9MYRT|nr:hypothetical protein MLD38_016593 [Melastoma candidum]
MSMVVRSVESLSLVSLDSVVPERDSKTGKYSGCCRISASGVWTLISLSKMLIPGIEDMFLEMKNGFIANCCQLINQEDVRQELNWMNEASSDPKGLFWQVVNCAWDQGLEVVGENDLSCYNRDAFVRIVNVARPRNNPNHRCFSSSSYRQASPFAERAMGFSELDFVIKSMHGGLGEDILPC